MDLLKYDHHAPTNEFLGFCLFLPNIMQPTRITSNSKTLNDNIFTNALGADSVSGNLTDTLSGLLPKFFTASNIFSNTPSGSTSNIYERDWIIFDQEIFLTIKQKTGRVLFKETSEHKSFFPKFFH